MSSSLNYEEDLNKTSKKLFKNQSNKCSISIGTFNVLSLSSIIKKRAICQDFMNYHLDILCLQETKICSFQEVFNGNIQFIFLESNNPHYGLGFAINKSRFRTISTRSVSDRIGYVRIFDCFTDSYLNIINAYAPHMGYSMVKCTKFYEDLNKTLKDLQDHITIIGGDFNAKIGAPFAGDSSLAPNWDKSPPYSGKYSRGIRNRNGNLLASFLESNNLYLSNTHFPQKARHISTWMKNCSNYRIFNQIDYIIIDQKFKSCLTSARSFSGMKTASDHRLVKCVLDLSKMLKGKISSSRYNFTKGHSCSRIDIEKLNDIVIKNEFQNEVLDLMAFRNKNNWSSITDCINQASIKCLGYIQPNVRKNFDPRLQLLVTKRKNIQNLINTLQPMDDLLLNKFRHKLKKIQNEIKNLSLKIYQENIEEKIDQINFRFANNLHRAGFALIKTLKKNRNTGIHLKNEKDEYIIDSNQKLLQMEKYFHNILFDPNDHVKEFPTNTFLNLQNPINGYEVTKAIKKLNNGRSPGDSKLYAEQFKALQCILAEEIAELINYNAFDNHELGKGVMVTIPKPGKPRNVQNLRPIVLLNNIRKILSLVVLNRINPKVEEFLSSSQCAFRKNRGTSDAVWAHKFICARALKYKWSIFILGIDLSQAFDSICRTKLLENLTFLDSDDIILIQLLLSNTKCKIRLNNFYSSWFICNKGTPQGDGLSPTLFTIYLELALRDLYHQIFIKYNINLEDIVYADDTDFITSDEFIVNIILNEAPSILEKWHLKMNISKTEIIYIDKFNNEWKKSKKLGCYLNDSINLKDRKTQTECLFNAMYNLWKPKNRLNMKIRIKIFCSHIRSKLLYNCCTWALTTTELKKLESFDRRLLRRAIGINYPNHISCKALYQKTGLKPLRFNLFTARWNMFAKVL
ncbi:MAG: hypothetical protein RL065_80, partial [Bacteroidota bacterium]